MMGVNLDVFSYTHRACINCYVKTGKSFGSGLNHGGDKLKFSSDLAEKFLISVIYDNIRH